MKPRKSDQNHVWIKTALRIKGKSFSSIAAELGVQPATVSLVSRGLGRSRRIEAAIAAAIGFSAKDLWPERYRRSPRVINDMEWAA